MKLTYNAEKNEFESNQSGIETSLVIASLRDARASLNRTRVELKQFKIFGKRSIFMEFESNQSGIETKFVTIQCSTLICLNRTRVELKHAGALVGTTLMARFESNQSGIETAF